MGLLKEPAMMFRLVLTLVLLFPLCSSLHLPVPGTLIARADLPVADNAGLLGNVLRSINLYRSEEDAAASLTGRDQSSQTTSDCIAPGYPDIQSSFINQLKVSFAYDRARSEVEPVVLKWNTALATAAKVAASACNINYTFPDVKTASFGHEKDDGTGSASHWLPDYATNAAIQYWRDWQTESPGHNEIRTDYQAIIDSSVNSFGCAWSDWNDSCASYLLYCFFWNATCPNELPKPPTKRANDIFTISNPNPDLNTQAGKLFANLRKDQGVPSNAIVLRQCPSLAAQTLKHASQCSHEITTESNMIWSETTLSSIVNKTDPWHEIMLDAELKWYSLRTASPPSEPANKTDYALIVDPKTRYYSCSWADCRQRQSAAAAAAAAEESIRIFCAFSDVSTGSTQESQLPGLALREEQGFDLPTRTATLFSAMRAAAGVPANASKLVSSWDLETLALKDAIPCDGVVVHSDTEIMYEYLTKSSIWQRGSVWGDRLYRAAVAWAKSGAEPANFTAANGLHRPWDVLMNPAFKSFGCNWTPICHQNTKQESYQLYCAFSKNPPLRKRESEIVRSPSKPRPDSGLHVREPDVVPTANAKEIDVNFIEIKEASDRISLLRIVKKLPVADVVINHSEVLDRVAAVLAGNCNGNRPPPYNMAIFKYIVSDDFDSPDRQHAMEMAFDVWGTQTGCDTKKNADCDSDYRKLTDPRFNDFGIGWSSDFNVTQFPCGILPNHKDHAYGEAYFYVVMGEQIKGQDQPWSISRS